MNSHEAKRIVHRPSWKPNPRSERAERANGAQTAEGLKIKTAGGITLDHTRCHQHNQMSLVPRVYTFGLFIKTGSVIYEYSVHGTDTIVTITPHYIDMEKRRWSDDESVCLMMDESKRIKYHQRVLDVLAQYVPFYVAVKQVMRRLPSELEWRVYEFM